MTVTKHSTRLTSALPCIPKQGWLLGRFRPLRLVMIAAPLAADSQGLDVLDEGVLGPRDDVMLRRTVVSGMLLKARDHFRSGIAGRLRERVYRPHLPGV